MAKLLLLIQFAGTLGMVGVIWMVQLVHYPLFASVGEEHFGGYERAHQWRISLVVIPLMLTELATAIAMLAYRPAGVPAWAAYAGLTLVAAIWLSTFAIQAPLHGRLGAGFDARLHQWLVLSNWLRTVAWSARAGLLGWCVWRVMD